MNQRAIKWKASTPWHCPEWLIPTEISTQPGSHSRLMTTPSKRSPTPSSSRSTGEVWFGKAIVRDCWCQWIEHRWPIAGIRLRITSWIELVVAVCSNSFGQPAFNPSATYTQAMMYGWIFGVRVRIWRNWRFSWISEIDNCIVFSIHKYHNTLISNGVYWLD